MVSVASQLSDGWLPIIVRPSEHSVRWMKFGQRELSEPFFGQTVAALSASAVSAPEIDAEMGIIDEVAKMGTVEEPAGFIFHISRCGSTLIANALRAICRVSLLSEAQPVNALIDAHRHGNLSVRKTWECTECQLALPPLLAVFGRYLPNRPLLVKFSSWNLLYIAAVRSRWPKTPCLVVTRSPLEIMVSSLRDPTGWMLWHSWPLEACRMLGWDGMERQVASMTSAQYCARVIGALCDIAHGSVSAGKCKVVDYDDISPVCIRNIAELFGLIPENNYEERLKPIFAAYSKDSGGSQLFADDRHSKTELSTPLMRASVIEWASHSYSRLRDSNSRL